MSGGLVAVNASDSATTRCHTLAAGVVRRAGGGRVIDLATLDAGGLLGRGRDPGVDDAVSAVHGADVAVLVTPVYRATYSALLKLLVERLPAEGLSGVTCVVLAVGGSPAHTLMLDLAVRPLVAGVGGWMVPTGVYADSPDFDDAGEPRPELLDRVAVALAEAELLRAARAGP